jgi:ATP-binding protein involved in chromosome partitioning
MMMENILPDIQNIILIASGKGGVGKSMVATNLAFTLSREGYATGLLDADLYGPSVPISYGMEESHPTAKKAGEKQIIEPPEKFGIKVMSLGFMMKKEDAVIWRGPMASNALTQLLQDTNWGTLDFLVVDMPPGTGDISITVAQKLPGAKAIIVITPQKMAVADGRRAAKMFSAKGLNVEVTGVVENMSYFIPEKHPDERYTLFGQGGGKALSEELNVPLLAEIPLVADVCELGDSGETVFASGSKIIIESFSHLTTKVADVCLKHNTA